MSFLFPLGLLALLAVPIILVLHLLRERRRRLQVPSLLLWQHLPRIPDGQRRRRLPLTLLLLLQLLAAMLIGLALSQPQLPLQAGPAGQHLVVIVDTTTSMGARSGTTTRLEAARARARTVIEQLGPADRATLIAMGARARTIAAGTFVDRPRLLAALETLQPAGAGADLAGALTLAEASSDPERADRALIITDTALGPLPRTLAERELALPVEWVSVGANTENRAVLDLAARTVGNAVYLYARLANFGDAPYQGEAELRVDGTVSGVQLVAISAGGDVELTWRLPRATGVAELRIDGQDALAADDYATLSLVTVRPVRVLLVSDQPDVLARALAAVPGVALETVPLAAYNPDAGADLTVFERFLPASWPAGGVLVVFPPPGGGLLPVDGPAEAPGEGLQATGPVLAGLGLGGVNIGAVAVLQPPEWATVQLRDGNTPLILRGRTGMSEVAIWTFDLADSNLAAKLAFPLLVARTVRDLTPAPLPAAVQLGDELVLAASPGATRVRLVAPDGAETLLAADGATVTVRWEQPGVYRVVEERADEAFYEARVGVNAGSAREADLRPQTPPRFTGNEPPARGAGGPPEPGRAIWPWLLGLGLVAVMVEWFYVHRAGTVRRGRPEAGTRRTV